MRAVVQRVVTACVTSEGEESGRIGPGLCVLLGVETGDTETDAKYMANKLVKLRIFEDEQEKMNRSVIDIGGEPVHPAGRRARAEPPGLYRRRAP